MRLTPYDDDTLFQVAFTVTAPVDNHPIGPRHAATFAQNWLEACTMVRLKYGAANADHVQIETVTTIDRSSGERVETLFYTRMRSPHAVARRAHAYA